MLTRRHSQLAWWVALVATSAALTSCTTSSPTPNQPESPGWQRVELPSPPGPVGRAVVRDLVWCNERWYAVGGVLVADPVGDRETRPAVWASADAEKWQAVPLRADTYWGSRAVLYAAACRAGEFAAMGSRSGGGHGFPRFSNFYFNKKTVVDDQPPLRTFGGLTWSSVGPLYGERPGWLVVGSRESGPAVWLSNQPKGFRRLEGKPQLADDDGWRTSWANAATWTGHEWLLVGSGLAEGSSLRRALSWASLDGKKWTRLPITTDADDSASYQDPQRVLSTRDGVVAVGLFDDGFASWTLNGSDWEVGPKFGAIAEEIAGAPYVTSLSYSQRGYFAAVSDGAEYQLWRSTDGVGWYQLEAPLTATTGGANTMSIATNPRGDIVVVGAATDDSGIWIEPSQ